MNKRMYCTQKGFTLMEILFVVLVIALIMSFALPAIRSVRFDIKNSRAKVALGKLAEARRSYYEYSRGGMTGKGSFRGSSAQTLASGTCANPAASGVPGVAASSSISQLFACGFLDWKDFMDLPYTFYVCGENQSDVCHVPAGDTGTVYVSATGVDEKSAGKKYTTGYYMYIKTTNKQVYDTEE